MQETSRTRKRSSPKYPVAKTAKKENGPIVISCRESVRGEQRQLDVEVGVRHHKESCLNQQFSIIITRFHITADFHSGHVESSEPANNLNTPLAESIQRATVSDESEHHFGPELSGNTFKVLAALRSRRAKQTQMELKRAIKVVDLLTTELSAKAHEVIWLVKLHSPAILAHYLSQKTIVNVLDYYTGSETLKATAQVAGETPGTTVTVKVDCDYIYLMKHLSSSRFSSFWESVTFTETRARRKLLKLFGNNQEGVYIHTTLD
jgi:hypothetical protein